MASPITENISAILAVQIPTDLPSLTRFLGMANYYRDFVPQMSSIAEPLNKLRQDGRPFEWTEECENAFKSIKEKLASPPVLAYPDWSQPFYLEADACKSAIGGVLSQLDAKTNKLRPLGYYSALLDAAQQNYSPTERELWGLVASSRKWRTYCRAAFKIVLVTDHNPLRWLRDQKDPTGKYGRWLLKLEELPYEISYRNGLDHLVPDFITRLADSKIDEEVSDVRKYLENRIFSVGQQTSTEEWQRTIRVEQNNDAAISFAMQQLNEQGSVHVGRFKRYQRLRIEKDILFRGKQIILPNTLRYKVVKDVHTSVGHPGGARTACLVAENYIWSNMNHYVKDFCAHCELCLGNKPKLSGAEPFGILQTGRSQTTKDNCLRCCSTAMGNRPVPVFPPNRRYVLEICGSRCHEGPACRILKSRPEQRMDTPPWQLLYFCLRSGQEHRWPSDQRVV